jgi:hypothetical protein
MHLALVGIQARAPVNAENLVTIGKTVSLFKRDMLKATDLNM